MEEKTIGIQLDDFFSMIENNLEELRLRVNKLESENTKLQEIISKLSIVRDEQFCQSEQEHLSMNSAFCEKEVVPVDSYNGYVETLYAVPIKREQGTVLMCDNDNKEYSLFVLNSFGNTAEVNYNKDIALNLLDDIEVNLLPFVDCKLAATGVPSTIQQVEPGLATFDNNIWILEKKVKVEIR